jgi:hypothetical protein
MVYAYRNIILLHLSNLLSVCLYQHYSKTFSGCVNVNTDASNAYLYTIFSNLMVRHNFKIWRFLCQNITHIIHNSIFIFLPCKTVFDNLNHIYKYMTDFRKVKLDGTETTVARITTWEMLVNIQGFPS